MPQLTNTPLSLVGAYLFLTVPLLIIVYGAFCIVIRPARKVWLASLAGGLLLVIINLLVDILAYYAHWWHYALSELILHVPLPFYISPFLIFGSLAYLLIWRFWFSRARWLSYIFLIGVPLFCILRDVSNGFQAGYQQWDNPVMATIVTIVMWLVGFLGGFGIFWRVASTIKPQTAENLIPEGRRVELHENETDYLQQQ